MAWLADRLTRKRLIAVGILVAIALAAIVVGDPLMHPGEGAQADGQRGMVGIPRLVWFSALAIAFILALPPDGFPRQRSSNEDED